jgi:cell division protease FtsH
MTNGSSDSSGIEVYTRDKCIDVTFADVVGHDEVIKDLEIIRSMFVDNRIGSTLNCDIPKGILLIYANASSFIELYVGMGAKRVRKLFRMARRYEPCVLFIDEIDAIGMSRDSTAGGNSEQRQAITALLQELDGFTHLGKILVVAATNDANCLDPALTRAGRFDRRIEVTPPKDWHVRLKLLELYTKDKQLDETVDLENIAKTITGFTGSDVKTLVNEAVLNTIADKRLAISADDFQIAIEKKMFHGNRRNEKAIEHDRRICAYHEAGHAIVTYLTKLPIVQVSIVQSTSGVGGYVMHEDLETTLYSKAEIEGRIHVAYGGRCAEQLHFGEGAVTVGASNDIKQATGLLTKYICEYGFDTETGCVVSDAKDESVKERIKVLAKKFESETFEMLSKYQEAHEAFANYLFDAEILSGAETEEFLAKYINLEEV